MDAASDPPRDPPDPRDESTERLVRGVSDGDVAHFNALYERLAPSLYTWADLRSGHKLRTWLEPADLVQEVWFRALRSLDAFDPDTTSFRYWVFRVAKNALLEALRKSESAGRGAWQAAGDGQPNALEQVPDSITGVSRRLARGEEVERFRGFVAGLDEEDQELVIHIGLEGMSHAQVGTRLDLLPKTVTKRWQRLRERLAQAGDLQQLLAD